MSDSSFAPPPPPVTKAQYSKLNTSLWILFLISAGLGIAEIISQVVRSQSYSELSNNIDDSVLDRATSAENTVAAFSLFGAYVSIAIFVLLIIYTFRLVKKIRRAGNSVRMSNGMAIGSWFIPLANAILCYLFYVDIANADKNNRSRGIAFLNLWWWPYIVGATLVSVADNLMSDSETFEDLLAYSNLSIFGNVVALTGVVFAVLFFRQIRHFEATLDKPANPPVI